MCFTSRVLASIAVLAACQTKGVEHDSAANDESSETSSSGATESTSDASASASAEGVGTEGASLTAGPSGPCSDGDLELTNVVLELTTHRVAGEDYAAPFDTEQGSYACAMVLDDRVRIWALFGPFEFGTPGSHLYLELFDGARVYDLATDPGPPATGDAGLIQLGYAYQIDSTTTWGYDTINQGGTGTVDVVALPIDGGTDVEYTAVGEIGGADGWQFDLHFTATASAQ